MKRKTHFECLMLNISCVAFICLTKSNKIWAITFWAQIKKKKRVDVSVISSQVRTNTSLLIMCPPSFNISPLLQKRKRNMWKERCIFSLLESLRTIQWQSVAIHKSDKHILEFTCESGDQRSGVDVSTQIKHSGVWGGRVQRWNSDLGNNPNIEQAWLKVQSSCYTFTREGLAKKQLLPSSSAPVLLPGRFNYKADLRKMS